MTVLTIIITNVFAQSTNSGKFEQYKDEDLLRINIKLVELFSNKEFRISKQLADYVLEQRPELLDGADAHIAYFYNNYGTILIENGKLDLAKRYYIESINICNVIVEEDIKKILARFHNRLGKLYGLTGDTIQQRKHKRLSRRYRIESTNEERLSQQKIEENSGASAPLGDSNQFNGL